MIISLKTYTTCNIQHNEFFEKTMSYENVLKLNVFKTARQNASNEKILFNVK